MAGETELIKERLNLAEIVGEYVSLRRAGNHFKGLCPFHQEKTPSFIVSPDKGIWHCFGCNTGGDIFSFMQKIEGLEFPAALHLLAARAGVTLTSHHAPATDTRERLFALMALAARFYHEVLVHHSAGKKALEYLATRGVQRQTIDLFQVGYATTAWDSVQKFLRQKGFSSDEMITTGVVGKSGRGSTFDRFRGRIVFPIEDMQGRVVAFGGRITPWTATGAEGKYINSPETPLYSKRRTVYNLNRAKQSVRSSSACLVVEGYMDVVMLTQVGIQNVVASSGTAFTPEHIEQLSRFTSTLHVAFDGDDAGWKATLAATDAALNAGMRVATVRFPTDKDPADIAHEAPQTLPQYLNQPRSLAAVMLERLHAAGSGQPAEQQLAELLPVVARVANIVQQGEMIQEIAAALHVPEERLIALLEQTKPIPTLGLSLTTPGAVPPAAALVLPDRHMLGLVLLYPVVRAQIFPQLEPEMLLDAPSQQLYKVLQILAKRHTDFLTMPSDALLSLLPDTEVPLAEALRVLSAERLSSSSHTPEQEGHALLVGLQRRSLERHLQRVQQELTQATDAQRPAVLQKFQTLVDKLHGQEIQKKSV